jgi:hypothetical protein
VFSGGVVALNLWDMLSRAPNFKAFKAMYDQVRIDYATVTLNVTNSTINTNEANKTYDIYCAWDRTGLDEDFVYPEKGQGAYDINGLIISLSNKITEMGHSKTTLNAFQRWRKTLYISPRTLAEKSQYITTGQIDEWRLPYNANSTSYPLIQANRIEAANNAEAITKYKNFLNSDNPCLPVENSKYSFKPTLLVGAFGSSVVQGNGSLNQPLTEATQIMMSADFKIVCTFRGSKGVANIT